MKTLLIHPYEYVSMHLHPAGMEEKAGARPTMVRSFFNLTIEGIKTVFIITVTYLAICCFAKMVEAEMLRIYCSDVCTALSVMLVAP